MEINLEQVLKAQSGIAGKTEDYIREFLMILFIQKRIIIGTFLVCFFITCLVAFFWPPTYMSEAKVLVKHKKLIRNPEVLERVLVSEPRLTENDIKSEMEIMTSMDVIQATIKQLQGEGKIFPKHLTDKEFRKLVAKIKNNLKAEVIPKSAVFKVRFVWKDPIQAEDILKTLLDMYLKYRLEVYAPSKAEDFFKKQVEHFKDRLSQIEKELRKLVQATGSPVPDEKIRANLRNLQSLTKDLNNILNKYIIKKNFLNYVKKELNSKQVNCFSFIDSINIGEFGKRLQNLLIKRAKLRSIYTDQSPPVQRINEQIKATDRALKAEVRRYLEGETAKLKAMENTIKSIIDRVDKIKQENIKLYNTSLKMRLLQRQFKLAEESYETFLKRWNEARIDRSNVASNLFSVNIISGAKASLTPVFPNKKKIIPIGFVVALIFGITIGFLVEFFDHTFKRPEDVERFTGLQTIFSIPKF